MSNSLADYFSGKMSSQQQEQLERKTNDQEDMGPSVSMAVQADDDDEFKKNTFNLKRTRSMGLFNDFMDKPQSSQAPNQPVQQDQHVQQAPQQRDEEVHCNDSMDSDFDFDYESSDSEDSYDEDGRMSDENDDQPQLQLHRTSDHNEYEDVPYNSSRTNLNANSTSVSPPSADNDAILIPQDDNDLVMEPKTHVDYLSHNWNESEVLNSWKYIILKKKKKDDVIDTVSSARLENASWRTWAKARNHLDTVSPEIVNWSKDSDVTWLYGPVVTDTGNYEEYDEYSKGAALHLPPIHNTNEKMKVAPELGYGSDDETSKRLAPPKRTNKQLKPILKKRTVTEIIEENTQWKLNEVRKHLSEMRHTNVLVDPCIGSKHRTDDYADYNYLAGKLNAQYQSKNNRQYVKKTNQDNENPNNDNNQYNSIQSSLKKENEEISKFVNKKDINDSNDNNDNENITYSITHNPTEPSSDSLLTPFKSSSTSTLPTLINSNTNSFDYQNYNSNNNTTTNTTIDTNNANDSAKKVIPIPPLSSILTTSSSKQNKTQSVRHIHFNDRVEQCISLGYSQRDVISMYSSDNNSSDEDDDMNRLHEYNHDDYLSKENEGIYNSEDNYDSDNSSSNSSDHDDDNEDGGLFINARLSKRLSVGAHSPVTDTSSLNSSNMSKNKLKPIIQLLPATTLNYGSDAESDNSDYDYNYGNAVSHNVNTYRGYDYRYDYNTVYTEDTSNFLPIDHSEVIDIPEGIDLQTSIEDDASTGFNQSLLSPTIEPHSIMNLGFNGNDHKSNFMYDQSDSDYSSSESEQQFIENSQNQSSEDDNETDLDGIVLKRTASLGKNGSASSLKELSGQGSNTSLLSLGATHNFITGKVLTPHVDNNQEFTQQLSKRLEQQPQPQPSLNSGLLKRQLSKNNFIFDSDSSDEDIDMPDAISNNNNSRTPDNITHSNAIPIPSKVTTNFGIDNKSPSPAQIGSNDVAINGCFSPRNDSIKTVVSEVDL